MRRRSRCRSPLCNFAVLDRQRHDQPRITVMIATTVEKRSARRCKVLKGATIAFEGNGIECTVRNLSPGGAAIEVASPAGLPRSFVLVIESDQLIRRCRPVWR